MRILFAVLLAPLLAGATPPPTEAEPAPAPPSEDAVALAMLQAKDECAQYPTYTSRDPDKPLEIRPLGEEPPAAMFAAVDRHVDDCPVLVVLDKQLHGQPEWQPGPHRSGRDWFKRVPAKAGD